MSEEIIYGNLCPKCGERIYHLINVQSGNNCWKVYSNSNYEEEGFYPDNRVNNWVCPECDEVLFTDEMEAVKFLRDES